MPPNLLQWLVFGLVFGIGPSLHAFDRSRVERSVVRIINETHQFDDDGDRISGSGSGTVINDSGDVLTNYHVIEDSSRLFVASEFSNGRQAALPVWKSEEKDLAVIRAAGLGLPATPLFIGELDEGSSPRVFAMGYPGAADRPGSSNLKASLTDGVLSHSFPGSDWRVTVLQHSAVVSGGSSGGPLFDDCGRMLGVNTQRPHVMTVSGRVLNNSGINWASHIKEAIGLLRDEGIQFTEDVAPCVAGGADPATTRAAEEATELASTAQSKAENAQQGAQQARQQADSATQTAQEAQAQAEQATQAAQEAKQAGKMTNTLVALVAVVTLLALGLALRKPRQEIIRIAGQIIEPLSRSFKPGKDRAKKSRPKVARAQLGPPKIALTGFDPQGQPVKIELRRADLDRNQGGFTIGRHPLLVDRVLNDDRVSRRHARFSAMNGTVCVEDLNSGNGTTLNGTRCAPFEPTAIQAGDTVNVGNTALRVSY